MRRSLLSYFGYKPIDPRAQEKRFMHGSDPQRRKMYYENTMRILDKKRKKAAAKAMKADDVIDVSFNEDVQKGVKKQTAKRGLSRLAKAGIIGGTALGLAGAGLAAKKIMDDRRKARNNKSRRRNKY